MDEHTASTARREPHPSPSGPPANRSDDVKSPSGSPPTPALESVDAMDSSPSSHIVAIRVAHNTRDGNEDRRHRPRTFPYFDHLPYAVESVETRDAALNGILHQLYISIRAEDFSPGALFWSRQLQNWLHLKFEMPFPLRATLTKVYYNLALTPGLDDGVSDRFVRMVVSLTRKYHYLKPGQDLFLDWRPLWREFKLLVLPCESATHQATWRRPTKLLWKLCVHAQPYFDPSERLEMLREFLPFFSMGDLPNAYISVGLINALLPTDPAPLDMAGCQPQDFLPGLFHVWSLCTRARSFDTFFLDLFSRLARGHVPCTYVPFTKYGIFTREQSDLIFTSILRLTDIPVGQANSPYSSPDQPAGFGSLMVKDRKKHPASYLIAHWLVSSLSPLCLGKEDSVLASLEGLVQSVDTFFHPSNQGGWTTMLCQLTYYLTDVFVLRWNREQSGELDVPPERRITPALKSAFVLCLRDVTFMGIFSKSTRIASYYHSALQGLAYLEPSLVLPGALQRFYPSLQGLNEVHRTTSSLHGLQVLANIMSCQRGFRCHITALLALALPGIDANDLGKTQDTLNFLQSVAYSIPLVPLVREHDVVRDTSLATEWVQSEMDRMEQEGQDVHLDYNTELSDEVEESILRSSTAGLGEFVLALLGKVFTLLQNLPDPSHLRCSSPEDSVINALPAALSPLFASLAPELFDVALDLLANFVSSNVIHQARDAMAWIVNAFCRVNPQKTLHVLLPMLIVNIRNEIEYNNAASDRSSGTDYLPRDRALVWNLVMIGMAVVYVGDEVLRHREELSEIASFMQDRCRGLPAIHVANFFHHLLLNLTRTYPVDQALYEAEVMERGVGPADWGSLTLPTGLHIRWHRPSPEGIAFAADMFQDQVRSAHDKLDLLMGDSPPVPRHGKNKEWSDEVVRILQQLRLVVSGAATLFNPARAISIAHASSTLAPERARRTEADENDKYTCHDYDEDGEDICAGGSHNNDNDPLAEISEDDNMQAQFRYAAGYLISRDDPLYAKIHDSREELGRLLSRTHVFLSDNQEDDVACFTALYSAYRTWITDFGIERSAHPLERHLRLYKADAGTCKISGLRKAYPRPLLIKRAEAYHLARVKHNASVRYMTPLDQQLVLDLATSCLSLYADVRRAAQSALESSHKVLIGSRPLVMAPILARFREAIDQEHHDRIKGGMYTLFLGSLVKTLIKDWRYAPEAIRLFIRTVSIDKPSIHRLSDSALPSMIEFGRPFARLALVDQNVLDCIKSAGVTAATTVTQTQEKMEEAIQSRRDFIVLRRRLVEASKGELGLELTRMAAAVDVHWKKAARCIVIANNMCVRFDSIAPAEFVELVAVGAVHEHPLLRGTYMAALSAVFSAIDMRSLYDHKYSNFVMGLERDDKRVRIPVPSGGGDADFTQRFLRAFRSPEEEAEYVVDTDYPGWLAWGREFTAYRARPNGFGSFDELEEQVRAQIGQFLTRAWFETFVEHQRQEPRESIVDRLMMANVCLLMHVFDLMHQGRTALQFAEVREVLTETYGDGTDRHRHRATAEMLSALLAGSCENPAQNRNEVWGFAAPMLMGILAADLTAETQPYWNSCVHLVVDSKDPRRYHEVATGLVAFRLDRFSNAAFKDASRLDLLESVVSNGGWHFGPVEPILEDLVAHLDHPYKSVREAIGRLLATIWRTRYHESYPSVDDLLETNKAASSIGLRPYVVQEGLSSAVNSAFEQLEQWRRERPAGQQTQSPYTCGSKTVLKWLDVTLSSQECTLLVPFFATPMVEQLLHMMDVKEDPELMRLAYHVYRHLPNVPLRHGEDTALIAALARVGRTAASWHQRLRSLINLQVVYFRRIFLTAPAEREAIFDAVSDMLSDMQPEVRSCAGSTLAGMIRCSPRRIRDPVIQALKARFQAELDDNPMPAPATGSSRRLIDLLGVPDVLSDVSTPRSGAESPVITEAVRLSTRRHAAVLGLGALVEAFPYATPPPRWMPEVLALLATRAASDPGVVGRTTKSILSDFKKTRLDSWSVDQKSFTKEQLEDLEGVFWKSYFA